MAIHAGGALGYAVRMMHEDPLDPRVVENQFEWINTAKNFIVEFAQWKWLQAHGDIAIPSTGILYFPEYVWQVLSLYPTSLGYRRPAQFIGAYQFDSAGPGVSAGLSDYAIEWGYYGCHEDVSVNSVITVTSNAAGTGDEGVQVTIEGRDTTANRNFLVETVTLDGTSGANTATTTATFRSGADGVRRIFVINDSLSNADGSARTRGILSATDSAGTDLERLNMSRELMHEHIRFEMYPTSSSGTFTMRYYKRVPDVISLDHVFEIPLEYQDIYHYALRAQIAEYQRGPGAGDGDWGKAHGKLRSMIVRQERQPSRRRGITPNQSYRYRSWRW